MNDQKKGGIYLLITVASFSTFEVISRLIADKIDPFQITAMRFLIGAAVLMIALMMSGEELRISRLNLLRTLLLGMLNVVISMNLLQFALSLNGARASVVALIFSSNPIYVNILAAIVDKERLTGYKIAGLLIGAAGVGVCTMSRFDLEGMSILSPLLTLAAAVVFAIYTVLGRRVSVDIGSLKMNTYSFLFGSGILFVILMFFDRPDLSIGYIPLIQLFYLGIVVTGVAYLTYFKGLEILGAARGSLVFFAKPVVAGALAIIILGEPATINLLFGTMLVILGICTVIFGEKAIKKIKEKVKSSGNS